MSKKFLKNELNTFKGMGRYLRQHFQIILRSQTIGERARDFDDDLPRKRMNAFEWKESSKWPASNRIVCKSSLQLLRSITIKTNSHLKIATA